MGNTVPFRSKISFYVIPNLSDLIHSIIPYSTINPMVPSSSWSARSVLCHVPVWIACQNMDPYTSRDPLLVFMLVGEKEVTVFQYDMSRVVGRDWEWNRESRNVLPSAARTGFFLLSSWLHWTHQFHSVLPSTSWNEIWCCSQGTSDSDTCIQCNTNRILSVSMGCLDHSTSVAIQLAAIVDSQFHVT